MECNVILRLSSSVVALVLGVALVSQARADLTIAQADRDNTLYEDFFGQLSNGAGEYFFVGRTSGGAIRRGLLRFDLSAIPVGSTIESAVIHLEISRTPFAGDPVRFHRTLADWGEGASNAGDRGGMGAPAKPGDATWVHRFHNTSFWAALGGDFEPTPSGEFTAMGVGQYAWNATPGMIADIQFWLDHPESRFGWCILSDEADASAMRFDSRNHITPSRRPRLEIVYAPPAPCVGDITGDARVDMADVAVLQSRFGLAQGATAADGDLDGDTDVDLDDAGILFTNLGNECP